MKTPDRHALGGTSAVRGLPQRGGVAMVTREGLLLRADQRAQRRLRAMVVARSYGDPHAAETRLYTEAERLFDALLDELRWETTKAELDALIAADIETDEPIAMHFGQWTESELRFAAGDR